MVWKATDRRGEDVTAGQAELSEQTLSAIRTLSDCYPTPRAAILPAMHLVQEQFGFLPDSAIARIAELVGVPAAEAMDVATFYEMFWRYPKGRKLVQVCESFCCELVGQVELLAALKKKLGIGPGQTTPDGRYTLITVQCLAACDKGPAVMVNDVLFERVTADRLDQVLSAETRSISHEALMRAVEMRRRLGAASGAPASANG